MVFVLRFCLRGGLSCEKQFKDFSFGIPDRDIEEVFLGDQSVGKTSIITRSFHMMFRVRIWICSMHFEHCLYRMMELNGIGRRSRLLIVMIRQVVPYDLFSKNNSWLA